MAFYVLFSNKILWTLTFISGIKRVVEFYLRDTKRFLWRLNSLFSEMSLVKQRTVDRSLLS